MRLGSIISVAVTAGVVIGAVGLIVYDMVHLVLGYHDID